MGMENMQSLETSGDDAASRDLGCRRLIHWWRAALLSVASVGIAHAASTIEVLDTYPSGERVALDRNQNFFLYLHYATDRPIVIWARPYFHGEPVHAGSNGSFKYTDTGEALGWFFFLSENTEVDEIRISAGDGSQNGTPVVVTYPVHIVGNGNESTAASEPEWLPRLKARDAARQRQAYEAQTNRPVSAVESLGVSAVVCGMLALGVCGFILPLRALWLWRGGWRGAAMLPASLMVLVVLRLIIGTTIEPTSHNLWPFEIMMVGGISVLIMVPLTLLRKAAQAKALPL
jgi:hypothetical protein